MQNYTKTNSPKQKLQKIPALHTKPAFNQIYIKGNRPISVYIKHAHKVLLKFNIIIIHALTAAINKAVKLALYLMEEYPFLQQQVYTDSVPTLNVKKKDINHQQVDQGEDQLIIKQRAAIHIVLTKTLKT